MTFDKHLTFKDHFATVVNTCNGLLGVLRRSSHYLPRELSKLFYTALIRSKLEYASTLFLPVAKTHLERFDVIQRKAARIILQVPPDSHAAPLLEDLGLQSLLIRRTQYLLNIVNT